MAKSSQLAILSIFHCILLTSSASNLPNIVFLLADDLGWNDVGYHGSIFKTPVIDSLAGEGVKLESYYVQDICTPSRSVLLTGRYQIHTGLQHSVLGAAQPSGIPLDIPLLPEFLRKKGYATHAVGKWHVGYFKKEYTPTHRGFQSFYGYFNGHMDYYKLDSSLSTGPPCGADSGYDFRDGIEPLWSVKGNYSTHLYTERAMKLIEQHNASQPLFLYLPYQNVHDPLEVPDQYLKPYKGIIMKKNQRLKAGMTSSLDEAVGKVVDQLKKFKLWSNTVFIFSTDNGAQKSFGGSNLPLRGWKWSLYEGGMRGVGFVNSPLLPNHRRGSTVNQLLHISDWFPTILNLAGIPFENLNLDGFDIWPTIALGKDSPRTEILHNIDPGEKLAGLSLFPEIFDTRIRSGIRSGDWKLMTGQIGQNIFPKFMPEIASLFLSLSLPVNNADRPKNEIDKTKNLWLFNIKDDPYEQNDLSSSRRDIVVDLLHRLRTYNSTAVPVWYPPEDKNACPHLHGGAWMPWM